MIQLKNILFIITCLFSFTKINAKHTKEEMQQQNAKIEINDCLKYCNVDGCSGGKSIPTYSCTTEDKD